MLSIEIPHAPLRLDVVLVQNVTRMTQRLIESSTREGYVVREAHARVYLGKFERGW